MKYDTPKHFVQTDFLSHIYLFVRATIGVEDHLVEHVGRVDKDRRSGDGAQAPPNCESDTLRDLLQLSCVGQYQQNFDA